MKRMLLIALAIVSVVLCSAVTKVSYDEAMTKARVSNEKVLLLFVGSDWCTVCGRMEKNVIATPEFAEAVKGKFEVVVLDYPQMDKQPKAVQKQNATLAEKYKLKSFPTIMVVNGKEQVIFRQDGYKNESPAEFLKKISQE